MDFITTGIIASAAYDILKCGAKLSAEVLKYRLGTWIKDEVLANTLATELRNLDINEDLSESAINRRLENDSQLSELIKEINEKSGLISSTTITNVTQNHSGSGDNVAGNKIMH